jgi:toxin-antitoxin system PIN domain toxin
VIAVDTNILVYAHRLDSPFNQAAHGAVTRLAEGRARWVVPWPCIHEFLAVVTHARIYRPPTPLAAAVEQVEAWMESPSLVLIGEADGYWAALKARVLEGRIDGARVHDARIAALCVLHGVSELWSVDRDFSRFTGLTAVNPLVGG